MTSEEKAKLKEELIFALWEEGVIQSLSPMPTNRGYHCASCSCSLCGNSNEDCVCTTNDILKVIEEVFSDGQSEGKSDHS